MCAGLNSSPGFSGDFTGLRPVAEANPIRAIACAKTNQGLVACRRTAAPSSDRKSCFFLRVGPIAAMFCSFTAAAHCVQSILRPHPDVCNATEVEMARLAAVRWIV